MKKIAIIKESGDSNIGKTIELMNLKNGNRLVLDQYPSWQRHKRGAASWAVTEKYGNFFGKFRTKREAMRYIRKVI